MLKHHKFHKLCDICMRETTYFCTEDGIICEDCFTIDYKKPKKPKKKKVIEVKDLSKELLNKIITKKETENLNDRAILIRISNQLARLIK